MRRSLPTVLPILLCLLLCGCESTGLRRVSFTLRAGGLERPAAGPLSFQTAAGWDVTLEEAKILVGPLYLNVAPPSGASALRRAPLRRALAGLGRLLLPAARADAGQDQAAAGRVIGQVTSRALIDALSPALVELGPGDGVSERALSAALWLLPQGPGGAGPTLPRGAVAYALGEARRGADAIRFGAYLPLDASMTSGQTLAELRSAGPIPVGPVAPASGEAGVELDEGLQLTLRVDPRRWLDAADFSDLAPYAAEADGRKLARPTDSVMRSLRDGVRLRTGVYSFQ